MKDLIIIGMGPAGVSAAIYAKRSNLDVLCFEGGAFGGTLNNINEVDNYPGSKYGLVIELKIACLFRCANLIGISNNQIFEKYN